MVTMWKTGFTPNKLFSGSQMAAVRGTEQGKSRMTTASDREVSDPIPLTERGQDPSGIIVLSGTRKVLYVNEAARERLRRLNRGPARAPDGPVPKSIEHLLEETLGSLRFPVASRGWQRFAAIQLREAPDRSVFVQAFCGPHPLDLQRSLIVLTMK
jgi:hypothetical protein